MEEQVQKIQKKRTLGLISFFSALLAIGIFVFLGVKLLTGLMDRSINGDIFRLAQYLVPIVAGIAGIALVTGIIALFRRSQRKGFAITGILFSLLVGLCAVALIWGYTYVLGGLESNAEFEEISEEALSVVKPNEKGEILFEREPLKEGVIIEDFPQDKEIKWEPLTDVDLPPEALEKMDTGKPSRPSVLLAESAQISNYLIYGLDDIGSSDAIMLLSVDRVHKKIKIISIPRDTYAHISKWNCYGKLGYAYSWGGETMAVSTVNHNFFMNVTDYITADLAQLPKLIDLVGGVEIDLDWAEARYLSGYPEAHVGKCLLSGKAATLFARIRESTSTDNEINRTGRQREVIMAILNKVKDMSVMDIPSFIRNCFAMCSTSFRIDELIDICLEVMGEEYTVEQYALLDYIDYWGGNLGKENYFYCVYDLNRAADVIHRIIYEELYISGYDD